MRLSLLAAVVVVAATAAPTSMTGHRAFYTVRQCTQHDGLFQCLAMQASTIPLISLTTAMMGLPRPWHAKCPRLDRPGPANSLGYTKLAEVARVGQGFLADLALGQAELLHHITLPR